MTGDVMVITYHEEEDRPWRMTVPFDDGTVTFDFATKESLMKAYASLEELDAKLADDAS